MTRIVTTASLAVILSGLSLHADYDPNAYYRVAVTFTNYPPAGTTLTNFPVLVQLSPAIGDFNYGTFSNQANGYDLRFKDAGFTTNLNYEIESWGCVLSTSYVWVCVPELTNGTTIYAAWGNSAETNRHPSTTNGATWSEGYAAVWHLNESSGPLGDSCINNYAGTVSGNVTRAVAGVVGLGVDLPGNAGDFIDTADMPEVDGATQLTVSVWARVDTLSRDSDFISKGPHATSVPFLLFRDDVSGVYPNTSNTVTALVSDGTSTSPWAGGGKETWNDTNWHCVAFTFVGGVAAGLNLYFDGTMPATYGSTTTVGCATLTNNASHVRIGGTYSETVNADGQADEARISRVARSAVWMRAEYLTIASNTWFAGYGSVQFPPGGGVPPIVSTANPTNVTAGAANFNGSLLSLGGDTQAWVYAFWDTRDKGDVTLGNWAGTNLIGYFTNTASVVTTNVSLTLGSGDYFYRLAATNLDVVAWAQGASVYFMNTNVWIAATSPNASEYGPTTGVFTVYRPATATGGAIAVSYTIASGTGYASYGIDYTLSPLPTGTVTIAAGASSATITATPVVDHEVEYPHEIVKLTLAQTTGSLYLVTVSNDASVTIGEFPAVYWDGSASGSWGNTTNWDTSGGGGATPTNMPGLFDDVVFNAHGTIGNQIATLGGDRSARGLTFASNSTTCIVLNDNTLTLGCDGIAVANGAAAHTVASTVALQAGQLWSNASPNTLTVGAIARNVGDGGLRVQNTGGGNVAVTTPISMSQGVIPWGAIYDSDHWDFAAHSGAGASLQPYANYYTGAAAGWKTSATNARPSADQLLLNGTFTLDSLVLDNGRTVSAQTGAGTFTLNLGTNGVATILQTGGTSTLAAMNSTSSFKVALTNNTELIIHTIGDLDWVSTGNSTFLTWVSSVAGNNLTKTGPGRLIIRNTWEDDAKIGFLGGAFTINEGTVYLATNDHVDVLGSGTVAINNGTLELAASTVDTGYGRNTTIKGDATIVMNRRTAGNGLKYTFGTLTVTNDATLTLTKAGNVTNNSTMLVFGVATNFGANAEIDVASGVTLAVNGIAMAAGHKLTKSGAGTLVIVATNGNFFGTIDLYGTLGNYYNWSGDFSTTLNPFGFGTWNLMAGSTVRFDPEGGDRTAGGNFVVCGNSTLDVWVRPNATSRTSTFYSLDFADGGATPYTFTLTDTDTSDSQQTSLFTGSTINHSGTIYVNTYRNSVKLGNIDVMAGAILTTSGASTQTITGNVGARLYGSADLLSNTVYKLVDCISGRTFYTGATNDTAGGLWSYATAADDLTATLGNNKGSFAVGGSASFAAEDAGYVTITGIDCDYSQGYLLSIELANFGSGKSSATVATELNSNALYRGSAVAIDASTVSVELTQANLTGRLGSGAGKTAYFAWDNTHALGADVTKVSIVRIATAGTVILFR